MKYYVIANSRLQDSRFGYGEQKDLNFNTGEAKRCVGCSAFLSKREWLAPLEVNVSKKSLADFIFGTYVGFIVSKRLKDSFENSNLKGLTNFRKVDLYYKGRPINEEYYYPEIDLVNAFIDLTYVVLEDENLCEVCQKGTSIINKVEGVYFNQPTLITSDIFFTTSIGQGLVIVSQQFRDFIIAGNYTNIEMTEATSYKWDSLNPF